MLASFLLLVLVTLLQTRLLRVCVISELGVVHCYTVECSCNLLTHEQVRAMTVNASSTALDTPIATLDAAQSFIGVSCPRSAAPLRSQPPRRHADATPPPPLSARDRVWRYGDDGWPLPSSGNSNGSESGSNGSSGSSRASTGNAGATQLPLMCQYSSLGAVRTAEQRLADGCCTWLTCPADPPAVFVGMAVAAAHAWLELSGGPPPSLPSRLIATPYGDVQVRGRREKSR